MIVEKYLELGEIILLDKSGIKQTWDGGYCRSVLEGEKFCHFLEDPEKSFVTYVGEH